ncbi:MAG: ABC transporter ATP-binding protein, partial [Hyphomicrobiaceae bacterium]
MRLLARDISHSYGPLSALDGISFDLAEREVLA